MLKDLFNLANKRRATGVNSLALIVKKALVISRQSLFSDCLAYFFEKSYSFNSTTATDFGSETEEVIINNRFDIVIIDLSMKNFCSLSKIKRLVELKASKNIALIFDKVVPMCEYELLSDQINVGLIPWETPISEFRDIIKFISNGNSYIPPEVATNYFKKGVVNEFGLSTREIRVLHGLVLANTNTKISSEMGVKIHSVKATLKGIYSKLEVDNRTQAALIARRHGLVDIFPSRH